MNSSFQDIVDNYHRSISTDIYLNSAGIERTKKGKTMSKGNNAEILNLLHAENGIVTIGCSFGTTKVYTYKCFPDFAATLQVGDWVNVTKSTDNFGVCCVVEIHDFCNIDFSEDITFVYQWAFSKVNTDIAMKIQETEKAVYEALNKSYAKKRLQEAVGELPDSVQRLAQKQFVSLADQTSTVDIISMTEEEVAAKRKKKTTNEQTLPKAHGTGNLND